MSQEEKIKNIIEDIKPQEEKEEKILEKEKLHPDVEKESAESTPETEKEKEEVSEEISSMISDDSASAVSPSMDFTEREKKIEDFLSSGLEDAYSKMDPKIKKEFKREGEKTAREINTLLEKARVKTKKIISLIKKWLSIIPGVNKFFLEQETKIRVDKIIKLKKDKF